MESSKHPPNESLTLELLSHLYQMGSNSQLTRERTLSKLTQTLQGLSKEEEEFGRPSLLEHLSSTVTLMLASRQWEHRFGATLALPPLVETLPGLIPLVLGEEDVLMRLARDDEPRVRQGAAQLASRLPPSPHLLEKFCQWAQTGFQGAHAVATDATLAQVDRFRRVTEIERLLETDLQLVKALIIGGGGA
jgi:hypothetical protein